MLKTNSKIVKERIRNYILDNANAEDYCEADFRNWKEAGVFIYDCMMEQKGCDYYFRNKSRFEMFEDWVKGLPNEFDLDFVYRTSAVKELGDILEETEEERNRFDETDAENLFLRLIWREVEVAVREEG